VDTPNANASNRRVERTREHNHSEANAWTRLFIRVSERLPEHNESHNDRDGHRGEDQISHLVLDRSRQPRWTKPNPEESHERKWGYEKNSGQREQSRPARRACYRARAKSPSRKCHRRELDYSDYLIKRRHAQWTDGSKDDRHNKNGKEEPITKTPVH
jgi:hypothetical protein